MFMMFHSNERRKPWLIAGFGLLLAVGIAMLLLT